MKPRLAGSRQTIDEAWRPSYGPAPERSYGWDPVIAGGKCVTTFMAAVPPAELYFNVVEYDAVPAQGGMLCTNGQW